MHGAGQTVADGGDRAQSRAWRKPGGESAILAFIAGLGDAEGHRGPGVRSVHELDIRLRIARRRSKSPMIHNVQSRQEFLS